MDGLKTKLKSSKLTETSEKCRFCLKKDSSEKVEINKNIQKKFFQLTQTEVSLFWIPEIINPLKLSLHF